jgi:hypothetical protein
MKMDVRCHILIIPSVIYNNITNKYEIKYDNNNNIVLRYYIHNVLIGRYAGTHYNRLDKNNKYNLLNKNIKSHLTNVSIQKFDNTFIVNDNIFYKKIKNIVIKFLNNKIINS